jgi:prepilin-type N-terminal cleavage/methylation domain-containing protein
MSNNIFFHKIKNSVVSAIIIRRKYLIKQKGFTLVEMLIVISILVLLYFLAGDIVIDGLRMTRYESEQAIAVESARKSMELITKDIRGANTSEKGDYPIVIAQEDEFAFFNDVNGDNSMEKIRYYVDGVNMIREIYSPGDLKDYSVFSGSTTIATYINNVSVPIFSYYDPDSMETDIINNIRMVRIYIMINITPAIAPNDYILESDVNLRNLKDY